MKNILFLVVSLLSFASYSQQKVSYTGLNRVIPDNIEIGVKGNVNFYFAGHKPVEVGAVETNLNVTEPVGGGLGFYSHFLLSDHFGIQTELNVHYRTGSSTIKRKYAVDTAQTIYKEDLSSYTTVWLEIPVYMKFHWEFTPIRRGHWKTKSQLGLLFGPRLLLTPSSKRDLARATTTRLYDNTSLSIDNEAVALTKYNSPIGLGVALGVDYELWNGFLIHVAYYRGLTTHVRKENGFKALDNRIEFGLGYRFN